MESAASMTDTLFIVQGDEEHCYLFDREDPLELCYELLYGSARARGSLEREDCVEIMEGLVSERLRSI